MHLPQPMSFNLFYFLVIIYSVSCVDMLIRIVPVICQLDSYIMFDLKGYLVSACMECFLWSPQCMLARILKHIENFQVSDGILSESDMDMPSQLTSV